MEISQGRLQPASLSQAHKQIKLKLVKPRNKRKSFRLTSILRWLRNFPAKVRQMTQLRRKSRKLKASRIKAKDHPTKR